MIEFMPESGGNVVGETWQQLAAITERQHGLAPPVAQRVISKELSCERRQRRVVNAEGCAAEP